MKRYGLVLVAALAVLMATPAAAQERQANKKLGTLVDAVAMDAASSAVTVAEEAAVGYGLLVLYISVTDANDSTTAVGMSCTATEGAAAYTLQDCETSSGVATCYNLSWTHDPSGTTSPKLWTWRVDIEGLRGVVCTITDTGGAAADTLSVVANLATKG